MTFARPAGAGAGSLFPDFATSTIEVNGVSIHLRYAGTGPPVLLLHGYPQTHVMWHRVAPALSERFTVVCPDLRGYGDSGKPPGGKDHQAYAKRTMARDQIDLMARLGFAASRLPDMTAAPAAPCVSPSTIRRPCPNLPCSTSCLPRPSTTPSTTLTP